MLRHLPRAINKVTSISIFVPELTFFARTRPAGCPCGERSLTGHVPSHFGSVLDLLQHLNCSADLPYCCIASCRGKRWVPIYLRVKLVARLRLVGSALSVGRGVLNWRIWLLSKPRVTGSRSGVS